MALTITQPLQPYRPSFYGTAFRLVPGKDAGGTFWRYGFEVQRAPDSGGSPGTPVDIYATDRPLPTSGGVIVDQLPPTPAYYHYRWRQVGPGYSAGAYSSYIKRSADIIPKEVLAAAINNENIYPLARDQAMTDGDYAVAAATNDGKQVVKEGKIEGQGRTLLQTLDYYIPNGGFDIWESASQPHAWTVDTGDSSAAAQDTTNVFAGDSSCKFSFGSGGSAGTFRGVTTNDPTKGAFCIPLQPGSYYQFKFASRVSTLTGTPTYKVTLSHGNGTPDSTQTITYRAANKFQVDFYKFLVPLGAANLTRLKVEFSRGDTNAKDFWIDGIRFADRGAQRVVILTSGTTWTVPSDFNPANNKVELIGGGGGAQAGTTNAGGGKGGGAGGYRYQTNFDPAGAATVSYVIGAAGTGGQTSGANGTAGGNTTWNAGAVAANGGSATGVGGGGSGGTGGNTGGSGGAGSAGTDNRGGGGGGGAACSDGGGTTGSAASGTSGGNGGAGAGPNGGSGGAGAANGIGGTGGNGSAWTSTDDASVAGAGGGGGGGGVTSGPAKSGGIGGLYGAAGGGGTSTAADFGGGGDGKGGSIVISWITPVI